MRLLKGLLDLNHVVFKGLSIVDSLKNYFLIFLDHIPLKSALRLLLSLNHELIDVFCEYRFKKSIQGCCLINLKQWKIKKAHSWKTFNSVDVKQVAAVD